MEFTDWRYVLRDKGWHKWFAWYPVTIGYHGETVWLQTIERQLGGWVDGPFGYEQWHFRLKEGAPEI